MLITIIGVWQRLILKMGHFIDVISNAELGKAIKTIFLCEYLDSEELRTEIHKGLNVIENWNSANSFIFYKRGCKSSLKDVKA